MTWSRLPSSPSPRLPEALHEHLKRGQQLESSSRSSPKKILTWWNFRDEAQLVDIEDLRREAELASGDVGLGRQDVLFGVFHDVIDDLAGCDRDFVFTANN